MFINGSNADQIIAVSLIHSKTTPIRRIYYINAEVWYTIENEMTLTLCDFAIRRTGNLYFNRPELVEHYEYIAECMSSYLGCGTKKKTARASDFEKEMRPSLIFNRFAC